MQSAISSNLSQSDYYELIDEAHQDVDRRREARGLPKWNWSEEDRRNGSRKSCPLNPLTTITTIEIDPAKPKPKPKPKMKTVTAFAPNGRK